jgi:hypothetical protein
MDEHVDTARAVPLPSAAAFAGGAPARPTPASVRTAGAAAEPRDGEDGSDTADGGTGDHAVDEALTLLATLDEAPLREHVAVFDGVHTALQDRLADTEG